jgi:U4/U6.U5 tri-snRNP-associated protein 2
MWNSRAFKGHVSPHEFLQEVVNVSGKKFKITEEGDALEFLSWLLNNLHRDLAFKQKTSMTLCIL